MPKVKTTNGRSIEFRYEPGSALQFEGVQTQLITISPEPVEVTEDQARVVAIMYDEVQIVTEPIVEPLAEVEEPSTPEPEVGSISNSAHTCVSCDREYKTQRGLATHITNKH